MPNLNLFLLEGRFVVLQLEPDSSIPAWALAGEFFSVSKTNEELSIVCLESNVPADANVRLERGWSCLKLQGPFEFSLTGILLSVLEPLAQVNVGIFALSTFDTDYVLVKTEHLERAILALQVAGHRVSQIPLSSESKDPR
jgi:uncharacterized protein